MHFAFEGGASFGFGAILSLLILVQVEVFRLLREKALGLIGKIFATLNGFFARQIEARFAGQGAQNSQPMVRGVRERFQRFPDVP